MKDVKHIFFDLDHTLWDFEKNSSEALSEIFHEMQLSNEIEHLADFISIYQKINAEYWHKYNHGKATKAEIRTGRFIDTLNHFGVSNATEKARHLGETYIKRSPHKTHVFPFAHETLDYLSDKYQLHIITNGFKEVQFIKLNNCGLTTYFDLILCSEEVGVNKPNPLVFNTALEKTRAIATQSVMIGDNPETDIQGAQNCGLHTVLFNPHGQSHNVKSIEIQHLNELRNIL